MKMNLTQYTNLQNIFKQNTKTDKWLKKECIFNQEKNRCLKKLKDQNKVKTKKNSNQWRNTQILKEDK